MNLVNRLIIRELMGPLLNGVLIFTLVLVAPMFFQFTELFLKGIPTMIMVSEASYHAAFDHCTAKWANQAGVKTDFIRLEERGIRGNGHMVMLEKNSLEIAKLIDDWIVANVKR